MNLAELIYKRLSSSEEITKYLSHYQGLPAVFSPEAPDDSQDGWDGKTQYPRIIYNYDLQASGDRKSAGVLEVSLLCQNTTDIIPEDIEKGVRECLRDVLMIPEEGSLYAFAWARTDAFSLPESNRDLIIGCDIRFDILEYASYETTDPDPIMEVCHYIKGIYPECLVVGLDRMENITEASKELPVVYSRLMTLEKGIETNTVAWMDGKISIHVLCPNAEMRIKLATAITNKMSLDGEIIMLDYSPMTIKRLQVDYNSDYLKDGQIFLTVHYGLLRYMQSNTGTFKSTSLREANKYGRK